MSADDYGFVGGQLPRGFEFDDDGAVVRSFEPIDADAFARLDSAA